MTSERLHKLLARSGVGSRRKCEALITAGRVAVNGTKARLGQPVDGSVDEIRVDGRLVHAAPERIVVALYKPTGVVSSLRAQGARRTVRDLIPLPGHLYPAGRLDLESEGLMILTNDGDLALRLTHPRYGHEKEYRVQLDRAPVEAELVAWRRGQAETNSAFPPAQIRREASDRTRRWIRVTLREGRKRQIRESARSLGLQVRQLIRIRIGGLSLGRMTPGTWRVLNQSEVQVLRGPEPRPRLAPKEGS
jgi:23S rRNA pseudouridine2605 synthase